VRRPRGFTLVELMITFVLMGILLAIGVPSFRSFRLSLVRQQARAIVIENLRAARQRAVTQHTPVVVVFGNGVATTDVTGFSIHSDTNNDRMVQAGELQSFKKLPRDTKFATVELAPTDSLLFDSTGILKPGTSGGRLIVQTVSGARDTIMVSMAGMVYRP
jgi:prepilin-type N-terminal cleavage/methylation domain-containing protein